MYQKLSLLLLTLFLTACKTESVMQEEIAPKEVEKTVARELYLLDKNGYIVPKTVELPQTESVAKQVLEYLVEDGPVTEIVSTDFQGTLPSETNMTVDLQDNTAVVDFKESAIDEKARQSVTWTLTQFDNIHQVQIQENGQVQAVLSRKDGINLDSGDAIDITNTKPVTLYFLSQSESGDIYYVPTTRRIKNTEKDHVQAVVGELIKGPNVDSPLVSDFDPDTLLLESKAKDGQVTLNFNEFILGDREAKMLSESVLTSLVLSLTEEVSIEAVSVQVNGSGDIVDETGEVIHTVKRPEEINEK